MPTVSQFGPMQVLDQFTGAEPNFSAVLVEQVHSFGRSFRADNNDRWSLIDCGFTPEHWTKMISWARECPQARIPHIRSRSAGLLLLLLGTAIARSLDKDDPLWHKVAESCSPGLRDAWFNSNQYPADELRSAVREVCQSLHIRNQLELSGKHIYWRTVLLQFGFSAKVGAARLPYWLAGYGLPDTIRTLLSEEDLNRSAEFRSLWSRLSVWNRDLSNTEVERDLLANAWYPRESHSLVRSGLTAAKDTGSLASYRPEDEDIESALGLPRFRAGQFQVGLSPVLPRAIKDSPAPVLRVFLDGIGNSLLVRDEEGNRKLECGSFSAATREVLKNPERELSVVSRTGVLFKERFTFWPTDQDIAIFRGTTGRRMPSFDSFVPEPGCAYTLVTGAAVTLRENGTSLPHSERGRNWMLFTFPNGLPVGLEAVIEGSVFWSPGQSPAATNEAGFSLKVRETSPITLEASARAPHGWAIQRVRYAGRSFPGAHAVLAISPVSDYLARQAQIFATRNGTSRGFAVDPWRPGPPATGAAVETDEGYWAQLPSGVIEAAAIEGRRLAIHWSEGTEDPWLTLGDTPLHREPHVVRRQRLRALGEPLELRFGLMNEDEARRVSLTSAVYSTGIVAEVSESGDLCLLRLCEEIEAAPELRIWVWESNASGPRLLDRSEVEVHSDNRTLSVLRIGVSTPLAWAVSLEGEWQGARFHVNPGSQYWPRVVEQMESTFRVTGNWHATAQALRWWRFPVLMDPFREAIQEAVDHDPVATLLAWISSDAGPDRRIATLDSDFFSSALRSFLWRHSPTSDESMRVWSVLKDELQRGLDEKRIALPALLVLNAHPVLFARLIAEILWTTQQESVRAVPFVMHGLFHRAADRANIRAIEVECLHVARMIVSFIEASTSVFAQGRTQFEALRDEALWSLRGWSDRSPLDEAYFRQHVVEPAEELFDQNEPNTKRLKTAVARSRACCAYLASHLLKARCCHDQP